MCTGPDQVVRDTPLEGDLIHFGLSYSAEFAHHTLMAYSDSDFAGNLDRRRSTTGSIITYSGGAISWMSRRQRCVALSNTEAEYIAISETAKDIVWTRRMLEHIDKRQVPATILLCYFIKMTSTNMKKIHLI